MTMTRRSILCFLIFPHTLTFLSMFGSRQHAARKRGLFTSAKMHFSSTSTSRNAAFVRREAIRSRIPAGFPRIHEEQHPFMPTRVQTLSTFSQLPRDYFTREDEDWEEAGGRVFKTLGFSEGEEMAANYDPEEFELPERGDFLSSFDETSNQADNLSSELQQESSAESKSSGSQLDVSKDVSILDSRLETTPPGTSSNNLQQRMANPAVTPPPPISSEPIEVDISNWHPHTGAIEPPTDTNGTDKPQEGNESSINAESSGSTASSIAAPLRRSPPSSKTRKKETKPQSKPVLKPAQPERAAPATSSTPSWNVTTGSTTTQAKRGTPTKISAPVRNATSGSDSRRNDFQRTFQREYSTPEPALTRDEFRARFAMEDDISETVKEPAPTNDQDAAPPTRSIPPTLSAPPTNRRNQEETEFSLELETERLEAKIYELNEGKKFNIKSYRQVSQVLFGAPDKSTNKEVLEGMSHRSEIAKAILEYRQATQRLSKIRNGKIKRENQQKLRPPSDTPRPFTTTSSTGSKAVPSGGPESAIADPLMLVDTSSLIFRAYYSMPPMHRNGDGMPIAAVMGFCNMMNSLILNRMLRGERPRLILCLDPSGPTFRNEMYPEYKANRPEAPIDLIPQFSLIYQAARAYGILQVQAPGFEADDVIATLSKQALEENKSVNILSIDKDLWQLVTKPTDTGARIEMLDPVTMTQVSHELVEEKWGVPPGQLGDVLALAGDTADNIPGVPGIGPKIAAALISEFGSLEDLLARSDEVPQKKRRENLQSFAEQAKLSQDLVRLEKDIPSESLQLDPPKEGMDTTSIPITEWRMEPMDADRILAFYDEMGFITLKKRLLDRLKKQKVIQFQNPSTSSPSQSNTKNTKKSSYQSKRPSGIPDPEDYKDVPF